MNRSPRYLIVLAGLVALLCGAGAGLALASPDGDDDPSYNASGPSGFGTQYSLVDQGDGYVTGRAVTDQAPDGSSVSATLYRNARARKGGQRGGFETADGIQLSRFDINGAPTGFGGSGIATQSLPWTEDEEEYHAQDILDLTVLPSGEIVVLVRAIHRQNEDNADPNAVVHLWELHFDVDGNLITASSQAHAQPQACDPDVIKRAGLDGQLGFVDAARTAPDGSVSALWTCYDPEDFESDDRSSANGSAPRIGIYGISGQPLNGDIYVTHYTGDNEVESAARRVDRPDPEVDPRDAWYGQDLEFGPNGDPYVLVGTVYASGRKTSRGWIYPGTSAVYHFAKDTLDRVDPSAGSDDIPGNPLDLAVDSQGRPLVWTEDDSSIYVRGSEPEHWFVTRLTPSLALDGTFGDGGTADISDPRLGFATAFYYKEFDYTHDTYLTARPDGKVLVTGPAASTDKQVMRSSNDNTSEAVIVGLTSGGAVDTGFAQNGFKEMTYPGSGRGDGDGDPSAGGFWVVGEPTLQSDAKILVPHTSYSDPEGGDTTDTTTTVTTERIAAPPTSAGDYLGVTRLGPPAQSSGGQVRPITASGVPTICGRRAISLVRADVKGRRIKLTGLVGSAFYGKKVTIQTDPRGAKASAFSKTATVTASRSTGSFSVSVPRPKASEFASVRYRATVGRAKSPALKLPQSLTSRSVKSSKGTITIKGRVKRSVLGKRNKVKIRRLACGRYRTVGTAKPDSNGNYSVTFKATALRGVSFYRAEAVVQVRPGSKKYAIQYARAIAIKTTGQTG